MITLITITICALIFATYVYITHDKIARRKAESYLAEWKLKEEKRIRNDAHARSRAVGWGKTIGKFVFDVLFETVTLVKIKKELEQQLKIIEYTGMK